MIYVNHVSAVAKLGAGPLHEISTFGTLEELWELADTSEGTKRMVMNEITYFSHVHMFMQERHGDNYTCKPSDDLHYQVYVCQSTLTHLEVEFKGHPGFKLDRRDISNSAKIIGKVAGQGKEHHINDMMIVAKIDGLYAREYAFNKNVPIDELTDYWKNNGTEYTLKFKYDSNNNKAERLFQNYETLGLCNIQVDEEWRDLMTYEYNIYDLRFNVTNTPRNSTAETMRYTFDFSKSEYIQLNQE